MFLNFIINFEDMGFFLNRYIGGSLRVCGIYIKVLKKLEDIERSILLQFGVLVVEGSIRLFRWFNEYF